MHIIHRIVAVTAIALALAGGYLSIAPPVSASTAHTKQAQIVTQVVVPLAGGGNFDVTARDSTGVSHARVTGHLNFTGKRSFTLTNVTLYDTACDSSGALFRAIDQFSEYTQHEASAGCHTSVGWTSLSGTASYDIAFVFIKAWASCCAATSSAFDNPFVA